MELKPENSSWISPNSPPPKVGAVVVKAVDVDGIVGVGVDVIVAEPFVTGSINFIHVSHYLSRDIN